MCNVFKHTQNMCNGDPTMAIVHISHYNKQSIGLTIKLFSSFLFAVYPFLTKEQTWCLDKEKVSVKYT